MFSPKGEKRLSYSMPMSPLKGTLYGFGMPLLSLNPLASSQRRMATQSIAEVPLGGASVLRSVDLRVSKDLRQFEALRRD